MPLQIDGTTVGEVRYARDDGSLATVGEARVWDGQWRTIYESWEPRTVTIDSEIVRGIHQWKRHTEAGDTSLIVSVVGRELVLEEAVVCDRQIRVYAAGERIPAGETLHPSGITARKWTFTSVR